MAVVAKSNVTAIIPALWSADLYAQAESKTFWHRFEGPPGSTMPVIRRDDLSKEAGDTIKVDMVLALAGAGQTGDTTAVDGNEEQLKFRQVSLVVDALSHGVRWTKLAKILINHDMRASALNQLSKWLAGKLDDPIFTALTGADVPARNKFFAGTATTRDTIADTDAGGRLTLDSISEAKAFAQHDIKIEPIRVGADDNEEYYGLAIHPYANLSIKKSADFKQAMREARERALTNPLFSGATFVYDGVIGYVSSRVPRSNNANSPVVAVADNILFGAQAVARGYAYYPDWTEQLFDYGRQAGVATYTVKGEKLSVFDLSSAGDGSLNTAIGSLLISATAVAPVA